MTSEDDRKGLEIASRLRDELSPPRMEVPAHGKGMLRRGGHGGVMDNPGGRPPEKLREKRWTAADKMLDQVIRRVSALEAMTDAEAREAMRDDVLIAGVKAFAPPHADETGDQAPVLIFNAGRRDPPPEEPEG